MSALIYCPFPDAATAERIGAQLLDEKLIACINIGAGVRSLHTWKGERGECEEIPALLKTDAARLDQVISRLDSLHPYETPAIMGWRCEASSATRAWLNESQGTASRDPG